MDKKYILVVDDMRITTKYLSRMLEIHGYETGQAYDGYDCLDKIALRTPDAIVMDTMMPRMDGYSCIQEIRSSKSSYIFTIPIVLVTVLNDIANQLKAIEAGADDFLSKPIEEKLLIAKIKLLTREPRTQQNG